MYIMYEKHDWCHKHEVNIFPGTLLSDPEPKIASTRRQNRVTPPSFSALVTIHFYWSHNLNILNKDDTKYLSSLSSWSMEFDCFIQHFTPFPSKHHLLLCYVCCLGSSGLQNDPWEWNKQVNGQKWVGPSMNILELSLMSLFVHWESYLSLSRRVLFLSLFLFHSVDPLNAPSLKNIYFKRALKTRFVCFSLAWNWKVAFTWNHTGRTAAIYFQMIFKYPHSLCTNWA